MIVTLFSTLLLHYMEKTVCTYRRSFYVLYLLNLQKKLTIISTKNKIIKNYRYINDWLTVCRFVVVLHDIKGLFHFCCMLYSILWRFLSDISKVPEGIAVVSDDSMIFLTFLYFAPMPDVSMIFPSSVSFLLLPHFSFFLCQIHLWFYQWQGQCLQKVFLSGFDSSVILSTSVRFFPWVVSLNC